MLLKKFEEYGYSSASILRHLASKGKEGVNFHWSNKGLYERLEADGYLSIDGSRATITSEALQEIDAPVMVQVPAKPRRVIAEHEDQIRVTSYSEGELALEQLYTSKGR
jgi:ribosomal protein S19E (S16A)